MVKRYFNLSCAVAALVIGAGYVVPAHSQTASQDLKATVQRMTEPVTGNRDKRLEEVAHFDQQVTGVTVSEDGRIFVNFPRWTQDVAISVAEVMKDGSIKAYPDEEWNRWRNAQSNDVTPNDHFVTVQSVVADGRGSLWVVDPAAPNSEKTIKGGPKLVQIDLKSNAVKKVYPIAEDVAGPASYLNDIRIAPDGRFAYLTDSGSPGGLVVVDLNAERAWRVLSGDPSTQAEKGVVVSVDGAPLRRPDGRQPMFNADGIALSADGKTLYWQALTGKTLYRISTDALQAAQSDPQSVTGKFEKVADTEPVDGLWMTKSGDLYLSSIGENAVKVLRSNGQTETVISDSRLRWPDTFAEGPDGAIYITASHIQDSPWFHPTGWTDKNFTLFKFMPNNSTVGQTSDKPANAGGQQKRQ